MLHANKWAQDMAALELEDMQPADYLSWLRHRETALELAVALQSTHDELQTLVEQENAAIAELRAALDESGAAAPTDNLARLSDLLAAAEQTSIAAHVEKTSAELMLQQKEQAELELEDLRDEERAAMSARSDWQEAWKAKSGEAKLSESLSIPAASKALEIFTQLEIDLQKIEDLERSRIATMERDLSTFDKAAQNLAALIKLDGNTDSAEQIALAAKKRLDQERLAKRALDEATADLQEHEAERKRVVAEKRAVEDRIQSLFTQAKASNLDELSLAITRCEKLARIERDSSRVTATAIDGGDGLSLAELEAEVAAVDLANIQAELTEVVRQRDLTAQLLDDCLIARREAQENVSSIHGQADAASAEEQKQHALSSMAVSTERFIKVFIGARLLRWAINRYREERQGPLLRRAGELFKTLTSGSFAKLTVDFEGEHPRLQGQRPDAKHVGVDGMSDGTRDQLYLALRLAAVEQHLQRGAALPFIADDLFVNYDDERAHAGFTALQELSRSTQVIYLTHHKHLIPIAKDALGKDLNVLEL